MVARDLAVRSEFGVQSADVFAEPLPHGQTLVVFAASKPIDQARVSRTRRNSTRRTTSSGCSKRSCASSATSCARTTEELETANEELKSSNEEMMSMNEELQSTNEELSTVNDELKVKIDQLIEANSDLANFFSSTSLAVVMLDRGLKVRSFSDAATQIFSLRQKGKGAPLASVPTTLKDAGLGREGAARCWRPARRLRAGGDGRQDLVALHDAVSRGAPARSAA